MEKTLRELRSMIPGNGYAALVVAKARANNIMITEKDVYNVIHASSKIKEPYVRRAMELVVEEHTRKLASMA
jgi:hypothetical protein